MSGRCIEFHRTFIQNHSFRVSYFDSITNSHTKILSKANDHRSQRNGFPDIATLIFFCNDVHTLEIKYREKKNKASRRGAVFTYFFYELFN